MQQGGVNFVHEDPATKSKRLTNMSGAVVSTIEPDPWGHDTTRNSSAAFQPVRFTSYQRDSTSDDEAMHRRYSARHARFSQPDPVDFSSDHRDPQSFNRYSYVQNDPVNFIDPSGLDRCVTIEGRVVECPPDDEIIYISSWTTVDLGFFLTSLELMNRRHRRAGSGFRPGPRRDIPFKRIEELSEEEIQERMAEGQKWIKWQQYLACDEKIREKYRQKLGIKMAGHRRMEVVTAGAGAGGILLTKLFANIHPAVGYTAMAAEAGQIVREYNDITEMNADYLNETRQTCGPPVPKP